MKNRFAELETTITRAHKKKAGDVRKKKIEPRARKPQGALTRVGTSPSSIAAMPAPAVAKGLGTLVAGWPKRAAGRVRSFGAVDFAVPGLFVPLAQPSAKSCWATVFTMLASWRRQQSLSIDDALAGVGPNWVDLYSRSDKEGLPGEQKGAFLTAAGLVAEPPQGYTIEGWEQLLRNYGPLWVTTDEKPGKEWAIHARVITAIRGDGTPENTFFTVVDPSGGRQYSESVASFIPKYEEEVIRTGYTRIQVVHWSADARAEVKAQSFGRRVAGGPAASIGALSARSLSADFSGALAAHRQAMAMGQSFDVRYNVQLVPQQTGYSCWAAGLAMIVGWRDRICIDPAEIPRPNGYWAQYHTKQGLHAEDILILSTWGFVAESPQTFTIEGFVDLLRKYGPLWVASAEPGPHIRVVTGICGDGTPDGTILSINDPWEQGMTEFKPSNRGSQYTETYRQFLEKQATLAVREAEYNRPIYVAHLPRLPDWMNSPVAQSFSYYIGCAIAMEAPPNPENFKLLTTGIWNKNSSLDVQGGQAMWFKIKNTNVLGTTITISDRNSGQTKSSIILPASSVEFVFSIFGPEPMSWGFDIRTDSSAFMVTWELWSTWVPGMPPNR